MARRNNRPVTDDQLPGDLTVEQLNAFCQFHDTYLFALGTPPDKQFPLGWDDRTVFRIGTNTYPAHGYTVRFETVFEWIEVQATIAACEI